jgi:hypothetical protein
VKLEHPLKLPPWDEILGSSLDLDLGTAVIDVQSQIEVIVEFCISYDMYYIANIPQVYNMWDEKQLKKCKFWLNVLTDYKSVDLETAKEYQALVKCFSRSLRNPPRLLSGRCSSRPSSLGTWLNVAVFRQFEKAVHKAMLQYVADCSSDDSNEEEEELHPTKVIQVWMKALWIQRETILTLTKT